MDIESDDSERWEDFFGSSTDLTPSLIGLYDTLTGSLNAAHKVTATEEDNNQSQSQQQQQKQKQQHHQKSPTTTTTTTTASITNSTVASTEGEEIVFDKKTHLWSDSTNFKAVSVSHAINNCSSSSKHRSFRVLSPNVQRLISHSSTTTVVAKIESLEPVQAQCSVVNSINSSTSCSTTNNGCNRSFRKIVGKHKLSHIPLSRNTCKLTQAGNELVETFESNVQSSCESLDRLPTVIVTAPSSIEDHSSNLHKSTKAEYKFEFCSKENNKDTNSITSVNGVSSKCETGKLCSVTVTAEKNIPITAKNRVAEIVKRFHPSLNQESSSSSSSQSLITNDDINSVNEACHLPSSSGEKQVNESRLSSVSYEGESLPIDSSLINSKQIVENCKLNFTVTDVQSKSSKLNETVACINTMSIEDKLLTTKTTTTLATAAAATTTTTTTTTITTTTVPKLSSISSKKYTPPSSPLLTYARVKVLTANNKPGGINSTQRISRKLSAEDLDRLTDMKPLSSSSISSSSSSAAAAAAATATATATTSVTSIISSTLSPKSNRKSNLILPDVAKLKHRPLSSSSICSTSSSSSSGSENLLNGKLGVSYLASVESLADQSENELLDGHHHHHHHSNLTVFERACLEIIDSERSFVEDLRQVITGYLEDWKERACLKLDELKVLFSNIHEIYDFNSILLKQLINSGMDPIKIAKCFIELKDHFNVYTTYCTSYPEAISLLTTLLQASHTNALLTSTQKMLQHTLPLGSYLLKPVQRILKYHLLLDNLRKHCDFEEVVQAYDIMRQVARNIDQVKRKLEQQSRVKELSGILDGWLGPELTVLGELRQEGLLMENNKPRMVFLFQTMLIITKPKEDNRLQFKSYIYRNNLMLREHLPGEPTSFNVIPYDEPRNQIKLTAKNRDQKRLWAQNIKGVILEQFDIPNRAKELVYKLGDEEDRTPDKNMWKWNFNSSTPVYLERRNQYRRSELRNRSKIKRKTLTNSSSFEGFLDNKNKNDSSTIDKRHHLIRKQSVDDTMISSLSHHHNHHHHPHHHHHRTIQHECKHHNDGNCDCSLTENEGRNGSRIKTVTPTGTPVKERSKSVPRISTSATVNGDGDSDEEYFMRSSTSERKKSTDSMISRATSTLGRTKSSKSVEVKMYTTKSIPKRIANLKKSRQKKETSKFYMDLNDFEDTVLKITESSENLSVTEKSNETSTTGENLEGVDDKEESNKQIIEDGEFDKEETVQELNDSNDNDVEGKSKNDVEIISELLKDKGFDRILKKPPKKRSFDNGRLLSSPEPTNLGEMISTPPPPPSYSPPPLNTEDDEESISNSPKKDIQDSEPIYESLLRNVHVPYKFSPILNRSKSQQYYTNTFNELKVSKTSNRPESDYVTLVYTENGDLHSIDNSIVKRIISTDVLRNSDSNINYENVTETETVIDTSSTPPANSFSSEIDLQEQNLLSTKSSKNLIQRLISSKVENVSTSENSLLPRVRKSVDNISLGFGKINKPPERRVSDVTEMCRQSIIHRQGSEAVGERMANLDYVDPKTLFNSSVNSSAVSLNPQRDSVFSLTSSNDSVCDSKRKLSQTEISSFIYEDNVEACLENDFRDSAVYSDDNERRQDGFENHIDGMKMKRPSSPPPPPPPPRRAGTGTPPVKTTAAPLSPNGQAPPPIPVKPNLPGLNLKRSISNTATTTSTDSSSKSVNAMSPQLKATECISPCGGKSWVLLQIENFNK